MILNNIKLAYKTLLNNKVTSSINILGLSVGLSVGIILLFYVYAEYTKDTNIPGIENAMVITDLKDNDNPSISIRLLAALKNEIPELGTTAYYNEEWSPQTYLKNDNDNFKINKLLVASEDFFNILTLPTVYGNAESALHSSDNIVLTREISEKIFGDESPVGKTIEYNSTYLQHQILKVAAVVEIPENSSWQFDAVIPIALNMQIDWYKNLSDNWGTFNNSAICKLNSNTDLAKVQDHLAKLEPGVIPEEFLKEVQFKLFPLEKAYFNLPDLYGINHGQSYTVSIILIVGILILSLTYLNFINLSTAQRENKRLNYKTIKSLGGSNTNLYSLITFENLLQLIITLLICMILTPAIFKLLHVYTNSYNAFSDIVNLKSLGLLSGVIIAILMVTTIIPSSLTFKFIMQPKGKSQTLHLRNILLIFQFTISIILISSILIIIKQNTLLASKNPGFTQSQIIYATTNKDLKQNYQIFNDKLKQIPEIKDYTFSSETFGTVNNNWTSGAYIDGVENEDFGFTALHVSPNFFAFFNIPFTKGETFNDASKTNQDFIVNKNLIEKYKISDTDKVRVELDNNKEHGHIIGEVKDFNINSFHSPLKPAGFLCCGNIDDIIYIKLHPADSKQFQSTLTKLSNTWKDISPDFPFEYQFLNESWSSLYKKDLEFQYIISFATVISLILSCLGLFSLTWFVLENKTKEIGIRKVNGAKTREVIYLLNKDFLKWLLIAFAMATPVAWFGLKKWLEGYAYQTELSWWLLILFGIIALAIALITVSWQSYKAANRNPVESLRYE